MCKRSGSSLINFHFSARDVLFNDKLSTHHLHWVGLEREHVEEQILSLVLFFIQRRSRRLHIMYFESALASNEWSFITFELD